MVKKRGALELSMNTIIIVVIGVVLLTLGLRWVYSIFGGLEEQRRSVMESTSAEIEKLFGESQEPLKLQSTSVSVTQSKSSDVILVIRNLFPEIHRFKYTVIVVDSPPNAPPQLVLSWLSWDDTEFILKSGFAARDIISIDPRDAPLGTYKLKVILACLDPSCADFSAQEPFVFRVVPK